MTLTPRQVWAYLEFSNKLDRSERADALMIAAIGAQGDDKAIEKARKNIIGSGNGAEG
jgi:poly-gamma-glutamate capsule biosynthesis protein CapA/YwtB (metallophosphatase superfamily)